MGASFGKSQSCTSKKSYYSYGLPTRRKTVPNENGNHFIKEYWVRTGSGPSNRRRAVPGGTEFWMVESEKQYREEVFHRNSENIYQQCPSSYRKGRTSQFDISFNSSTKPATIYPPADRLPAAICKAPYTPLSSCSKAACNTGYSQNTYGNVKNTYPNAKKYIPQYMGI